MEPFDWHRLLIGEYPFNFLWEVAFRTLVSFCLVIATMRLMGRRSVQQLTIFELVIILALGSAAGDVAFYDDVPLLPIATVFVVVVVIYRFTTYLITKFSRIEKIVEGTPLLIIEDGHFIPANFEKENISFDEFIMELRDKSVEHLGQVRLAIAEVSGTISIYFFEDNQVKPGLSILPGASDKAVTRIAKAGTYSCCKCGYTEELTATTSHTCSLCKEKIWVPAIRAKRVS